MIDHVHVTFVQLLDLNSGHISCSLSWKWMVKMDEIWHWLLNLFTYEVIICKLMTSDAVRHTYSTRLWRWMYCENTWHIAARCHCIQVQSACWSHLNKFDTQQLPSFLLMYQKHKSSPSMTLCCLVTMRYLVIMLGYNDQHHNKLLYQSLAQNGLQLSRLILIGMSYFP